MLTTLRVASTVRKTTLSFVMGRPWVVRTPLAATTHCLQHLKFCSDNPSRSKTKVCPPGERSGKSKSKDKKKDEVQHEENRKKSKSDDCCNFVGTKEEASKDDEDVCHESQKKFKQPECKEEAEEKEEESCEETDKESSESECSESEDQKPPVKDCREDEKTDDPEEDKKKKAVSEMCDCVKAAVAKFQDQKGKGQPKVGPPKSLEKGKKDETKPKLSEHVRCCNVERSKSASSGERSGVERCKSFKPGGKDQGEAEGDCKPEEESEKDTKQDQCECIKQALEMCKSGKTPEKEKPKPDKPGEKPDKSDCKPDKPDGKPDKPDCKPDKPSGKPDKPSGKPDKPGGKPDKPSRKDCNKKKKPVVKCR